MSTTDDAIYQRKLAADKAKKVKADYEAAQKLAKEEADIPRIRITPPEKPPINVVPYLVGGGAAILFAFGVSKKKR
jgi:hypothetical protein